MAGFTEVTEVLTGLLWDLQMYVLRKFVIVEIGQVEESAKELEKNFYICSLSSQ